MEGAWQIVAMDVVNVWEYPQEELTIKRVDDVSYPDLFNALQVAHAQSAWRAKLACCTSQMTM